MANPHIELSQVLEQGFSYHQQGNLNQAKKAYEQILQIQSDHFDALQLLGALSAQMNDFELAIKLLDRALAINSNHLPTYINCGRAEQSLGRIEQAIARYEKAIAIDDSYSDGHYSRGSALQTLGRFEEATISYKRALAIKVDHVEALNNLGNTLQALGRFEEAVASYDKAISIRFNYPDAHNNRGSALQNLQRYEEAIASYQQAIIFNPNYSDAHYNCGNALKTLNRFEEAIASYDRAILFRPNYAEAYNNRASALQELKRFEEAIENYQQAIIFNPNYSDAYYNCGNALQALGRFEGAIASYDKALDINEQYADAYYNRGHVLKDVSRFEEALASYQQAIVCNPNNTEAHFNIGVLRTAFDQLDQAEESYRKAINTDSDSVFKYASLVYLAILAFLNKDFKGANKLLIDSELVIPKGQSAPQNEQIYAQYLSKLLNWHASNVFDRNGVDYQILYVIGESHALGYQDISIKVGDSNMLCCPRWIIGCKQWHIGSAGNNLFKHKLNAIISKLPEESNLLFVIGEIDCRFNEGVLDFCRKNPAHNIQEVVKSTISNYLHAIAIKVKSHRHRVTIHGIPCPNIDLLNLNKNDASQLINHVATFNSYLKRMAVDYGFGFLDVHALTNNGHDISNQLWHLDAYHLLPNAFGVAFNQYYSGASNPQFIVG